ncbi:oxidoreductase [Alkalihalobacillus alcalophilus ATCC 27647 = CGMCC 1.3604]|uniref:Oxidoreductase n=1 Tax=Alkalihalobacillus alcalophilus ATCC 27647 = CGMCC 1.3604 TaxID=1218173 RepID=A0A094WLV9_ALKAL|nr:glucose 1-dehydrogenase [Alkalihalobacillus alcalophilus]KGA97821.1 oxidoreductase [Alkalihalobacillus alcalophilus ATCC 27647 = CGMCC 1.3604]MED1563902.1 glucose 1-dehydrogenase [Alkalihalobacillus alcalophilus]
MIDLKGKKAIVTGGGTGIGKGIALALADAGADVVVHYGSNCEGAQEVVRYLEEKGQKGIAIKADLLKKEQIVPFIQEAADFFHQKIDILVNNAGHLVKRVPVEEMSEELWHQILDINVTSTFLVSQQTIPYMKEDGGKIINMTSVAAHNGGGPGAAAYAASKAATLTFSKALAKEVAPYQINVNSVSPGFIGKTPFHDTFTTNEGRVNTVKSIPLQREGVPKDVAGAVLYLASDLANYITGETIEINGGMYMR